MYDEIETIIWNFPSWSIRDVRGLSVRERKHWFKLARIRAGQRIAQQRKAEQQMEKMEEEASINEQIGQAKSMGRPTRFPHVRRTF